MLTEKFLRSVGLLILMTFSIFEVCLSFFQIFVLNDFFLSFSFASDFIV